MRNESGFTLIEIIVSLVLVGMMAAIAGMGIVTGTKGYVLAKENSHMAQKAQIAVARIQRELMELTEIAARQVDPAFIIYDNTTGRHAIARDGSDVKMYFYLGPGATTLPAGAGDILVDNVNNFTLSYFRGTNIWGGVDIQLLSAIKADLALDRSDGSGDTVTFSITANPRNTNNYGGAPPTATPGTSHNYSCFVATAAEGNSDHPTIFLFSLLMVVLVFISFFSRHSQPSSFPTSQPPSLPASLLRQNKGNVLIGLIVTMMIFAALGAGMVAMTGTSTSSQVTANTTSKAYYLAESGFRYAASVYLNTIDADIPSDGIEDERNQVLENLDGSEFTLSNSDERFSLEVYPYYFVITTTSPHIVGSPSIETKFAGQKPNGFSMPATGRIKIGNIIYNYLSYVEAAGLTTFSLQAPGLREAVRDHMNVLPVGNPSGNANMVRDGDLILDPADASFFPRLNGKFMIDGIVYGYISRNVNTLENITDANNPHRDPLGSVDANTDVVLKPYLRIHSTGIVGQGPEEASRQIVYNVPIPDSFTEGEKVEFRDKFDDASNWKASTWGGHEVQDIGGNALKVTSTTSEAGGIEKSLKGLDWESTNINLAYAHSVAGNFLSYDAQVKVGFDGFDDDYAAGLSFRLDQSSNSYGVSFLKTDGGPAIDPNIIPPSVPDDIPIIVLWQQTGSGLTRNWLAYTFGVEEHLDDMVGWSGIPGVFPWSSSAPGYNSPTCWTNDLLGAPPVPPALPTVELLITPPGMDLSGAPSAVLTFWHKYELNAGDSMGVYIDNNLIESFSPGTQNWEKEAISIPATYIDDDVQIEFRMISIGSGLPCNWYIDDVTIHRGFPVNDSTLLVRIKEGATVEFNNGGPTAVEDGDILTQASGAQGVVVGEPIIDDSGDWATSDARGIIILNKLSGPVFQSGPLSVAGVPVANCTGYNARDNYIKVFYGYAVGNGANNDPFDDLKRDNMRSEPYLHWPPEELEGVLWPLGPMGDPNAYDYYTLVKWHEVVDPLVVPSVEIVPSKYEPNVIIRSNEGVLLTPDSYLSALRPELGLHTFGSNSTDVYFDDFGLLVEIAAGTGFMTPIQE